MNVLIWANAESPARAEADGYIVAPSRQTFYEVSDIVSAHLRLAPSTRGVITADDLGRMKPTALFAEQALQQTVRVAPGWSSRARSSPRSNGAAPGWPLSMSSTPSRCAAHATR
jgi:D-3-phosphoglycerate dehydrogenase / 2-oxoglutarate reductase